MATVNTLFGLSVILPVNVYHWQELPQVSFLSWQTRVTKHIFCCNKSVLFVKKICGDKIMFLVTKYLCCDKTLVTTNICSNEHVFVATKIHLSQQNFCHNKHTFVTTEDLVCVCRNENFVATKMILVAATGNDKSIPIDNNRIVFGDANKRTYTRLRILRLPYYFSAWPWLQPPTVRPAQHHFDQGDACESLALSDSFN